jgi:hypothetical protein
LRLFALLPEVGLIRLDGAYGDAAVVAQIMLVGVPLLTRGRGYLILEPPTSSARAHPPTARVTRVNSGEVVELFALRLAPAL